METTVLREVAVNRNAPTKKKGLREHPLGKMRAPRMVPKGGRRAPPGKRNSGRMMGIPLFNRPAGVI